LSSFTRIALFVPLALLISKRDGFEIQHVWYVSVVTVLLQAALSYGLLMRQFRIKLGTAAAAARPASAGAETRPG
jgi:hypothetical protein